MIDAKPEDKDRSALIARLRQLVSHTQCDDCWYSCPKSGECCNPDREKDECTCGADAENALRKEAADALDAASSEETIKCSRCGQVGSEWSGCKDPLCPAEYEQEQHDKAIAVPESGEWEGYPGIAHDFETMRTELLRLEQWFKDRADRPGCTAQAIYIGMVLAALKPTGAVSGSGTIPEYPCDGEPLLRHAAPAEGQTPRTDAAQSLSSMQSRDGWELARQLERELSLMTAKLDTALAVDRHFAFKGEAVSATRTMPAGYVRPKDYWCNDYAEVDIIEAALDAYEARSTTQPIVWGPATGNTVAWLVVRHSGTDHPEREVVPTPLTDDVYMDEGDEAFALIVARSATGRSV